MHTQLKVYHGIISPNRLREQHWIPPECDITTQSSSLQDWFYAGLTNAYSAVDGITDTHDSTYYGYDSLMTEGSARRLLEHLKQISSQTSLVVRPTHCHDGYFHFLRIMRFEPQAPPVEALTDIIQNLEISCFGDGNLHRASGGPLPPTRLHEAIRTKLF